MVQFLDPETAKILHFLDPEIWAVHSAHISGQDALFFNHIFELDSSGKAGRFKYHKP